MLLYIVKSTEYDKLIMIAPIETLIRVFDLTDRQIAIIVNTDGCSLYLSVPRQWAPSIHYTFSKFHLAEVA
jgi:hypothetical protein